MLDLHAMARPLDELASRLLFLLWKRRRSGNGFPATPEQLRRSLIAGEMPSAYELSLKSPTVKAGLERLAREGFVESEPAMRERPRRGVAPDAYRFSADSSVPTWMSTARVLLQLHSHPYGRADEDTFVAELMQLGLHRDDDAKPLTREDIAKQIEYGRKKEYITAVLGPAYAAGRELSTTALVAQHLTFLQKIAEPTVFSGIPETTEAKTEPLDEGGPEELKITFDASLSPDHVKGVLTALAKYYRACGGVGLEIESRSTNSLRSPTMACFEETPAPTCEMPRIVVSVRPVLRPDWLGRPGRILRNTFETISIVVKEHKADIADLLEDTIELGPDKIESVADRAAAIQKFAEAEKLAIETTLQQRVLESSVRMGGVEVRLRENEVLNTETNLLKNLQGLGVMISRADSGGFTFLPTSQGVEMSEIASEGLHLASSSTEVKEQDQADRRPDSFRHYREELALSRAGIARLADVSDRTISRLERGEKSSNATTRARVLAALNRVRQKRQWPPLLYDNLFF
jgi:DNA-binding XRE family transcriptional regulator